MHKRTSINPSPASPLLTVTQAAEYLNVGATTVNKLIATGELESVKINRCRRVTRAGCDKVIAAAQKRAA